MAKRARAPGRRIICRGDISHSVYTNVYMPSRENGGLLYVLVESDSSTMRINSSNPPGSPATRVALGRARLSSTENSARAPAMHGLAERIKDSTNIVFDHLVRFQRYAAESRCVIGVRAVDQLATDLIEQGHPTKNFHVKGKSASWGPQAGLICTDQSLSKLEGRKASDISKYDETVRKCVELGHARISPLVLKLERLEKMRSLFSQRDAHDSRASEEDYAGPKSPSFRMSPPSLSGVVTIDARAPSGKRYTFLGKPTPAPDSFQIEHNGVPLQVLTAVPTVSIELHALPHNLADDEDHRPLTADYDLLLIGPHLSLLNDQDNLPVHDVSHAVFFKRFNRYCPASQEKLINMSGVDMRRADQFYSAEDPNIGNASRRIAQMIPEINRALVGRDGQWVVHHNADAGSPASDINANYPATFFLPEKMGRFDEICIIEDSETLAELVREAKKAGYHMPTNPLWYDSPALSRSALRRSQFDDPMITSLFAERFTAT